MASVNILRDVTFTVEFSASDLGGGETYSNSATGKADSIEVSETRETPDHSTAMDALEYPRFAKRAITVTVRTKLINPNTWLTRLGSDQMARITVTGGTGYNFIATGPIQAVSRTYSTPSTLEFTIAVHTWTQS